MGFGDTLSDAFDAASEISGSIDRFTSRSQQNITAWEDDGFIVSGPPSADGTGLPHSKTPTNRRGAVQKRRMMHWFVPEFGVVKMYVNPQNVVTRLSKLINNQITKGGYVMQYWGEELTTLSISGTTGSSGVEGLNVLREVYRAEQHAFDAVGLSLASASQVNGIADLLNQTADSLFGSDSVLGDILGDATATLLGANQNIGNNLPTNINSLASLALGVELYWDGWVYRGYFKSFSFTESVDHIGEFHYQIEFIVTQHRGYRTNFMPWHRSATSGPSNNSDNGIPLSFKREEPRRGNFVPAVPNVNR